mgnify:CR=1 FL=1
MTRLPGLLDPLTPPAGPGVTRDSTWRWATVTATGPVRVRLDGDSQELGASPEWLVAGAAPAVGLRVWVQMFGRRVLVVGAAGPGAQATYAPHALDLAPAAATGGSPWRATPAGVRWESRIVLSGLGRGTTWTSTGVWELTPPVDGTSVPGFGGAGSGPVAGGLVPLAAGEMLYVELPPPGSGSTIPAGNLRRVGTGTDFTVPESWLPVAARGDAGYRTVTGELIDWWRTPASFLNGWTDFGGVLSPSAYRRDGSTVRLRGVLKGGTVHPSGGSNTVMWTLPAGYRPEVRLMFAVGSAITGTGDAYGRVDVDVGGELRAVAGGNVFMSLDGISFPAW